jgi:hypothetical protein
MGHSPNLAGTAQENPLPASKNTDGSLATRNLVFHSRSEGENPPDLQSVIDRWPDLVPEVRAAIVRMVK